MPIYEYECRGCGHVFEEWQKISDAPVRKCPACGKKQVERLVSATAFQLKGGGWYSDGYGSSAAKTGTSSANKSEPSKSEPSKTDKKTGESTKSKTTEKSCTSSAA